eukprot:9829055-Lingulodinium_polyedra.AAC.1
MPQTEGERNRLHRCPCHKATAPVSMPHASSKCRNCVSVAQKWPGTQTAAACASPRQAPPSAVS